MATERRNDTNSYANNRRAGRATLLSPEELASLLGVPLSTIYGWRSRRQGPVGFKVGRHVRYSLEDIHAWLESRRDTVGA